mmetsp:Transcript_14662/g.29576  ORF Transcript_14662/g.29576 Transcript_14662/m.29576 type:complete len:86 (+) Transcript_14662:426-683(+)
MVTMMYESIRANCLCMRLQPVGREGDKYTSLSDNAVSVHVRKTAFMVESAVCLSTKGALKGLTRTHSCMDVEIVLSDVCMAARVN